LQPIDPERVAAFLRAISLPGLQRREPIEIMKGLAEKGGEQVRT
jgi:hypothetical protein